MTKLLELVDPSSYMITDRHCKVTVQLNETKLRGTNDMRLVFNTSVTVDVSANDDELRKAFIDLIAMKAREVYGPAAMLAKGSPIIKITETSRDGMVDIDMMTGKVVSAVDVDD